MNIAIFSPKMYTLKIKYRMMHENLESDCTTFKVAKRVNCTVYSRTDFKKRTWNG